MTTIDTYLISISDRAYTSWKFHHVESHYEIVDIPDVFPATHRFFSGDIFSLNESKPTLISSPVREDKISGVLILDSGRTYGRTGRRLLYKCIPDDSSLPAFLIPYQIQTSFSKATKNKFVVFRFMEWESEHPTGEIIETIGDVDDLHAFYEYQIYRNGLHININDFTKKTGKAIHNGGGEAAIINTILANPEFKIDDHRHIDNVFSIDPDTSTDYDDAFSVIYEETRITRVNVYISNVFVWLETLGLWSSFAGRISTIYLPDKKRPMLPGLLSDGACSLKQGFDRFAFMMTVAFDEYGKVVDEPSFKNVLIRVNKNYTYEESALKKMLSYRMLFRLTELLDCKVTDSHDVVAFWMIYMNHWSAVNLSRFGVGVFRGQTSTEQTTAFNVEHSTTFSADTMRVINTWSKDSAGSYASYCNNVVTHSDLNLTAYTHITSPIRRIVDLVNQMLFFKSAGFVGRFSDDANSFIDSWVRSIVYVNVKTRLIRRIQMDCELLQRCKEIDVVGKHFRGIIIDMCVAEFGFYEYTVYLENIKLLSKVRSSELLELHSIAMFSMFLFDDEDKLYKKVRLQMV